jgi:hypothetical protein
MKKIRIGIIICVSLAVLSGAAVAGAKMLETKNAYLTINNDSVSKDELEFYMKASRSDAILRFTSDASSSADKDFWETEQNGITPAEYLLEIAVENLKNDRALFTECEERGLCEKLSYEKIIKQMNAENASRAEKLKNGEPVYGVTEYTAASYYDYLKSNLQIALREKLENEGVIKEDDVKLKQYYNQIKNSDPLFRNADGSFKPYADIHAKLKYLYREKCFSDYIEQAAKKQAVRQNTEKLKKLAAEIG